MLRAPVGDDPPASWVRADRKVAAGLAGLCFVVVLPYLLAGPGFFVDDWRVLGRIHEVGLLRAAEWGKLASRPGAWVINTILYGALREHPAAWVVALSLLNAAVAVAVYVALRRFLTLRTAAAVAVVWVLLPDHTTLRVLANAAPITASLGLLAVGIVLIDRDQPVWGMVAVCMAASAYEATWLPGVVALLVLHRWRGRGTTKQVWIGLGLAAITLAGMAIHPTYSVDLGDRGPLGPLLPAHFGSGLAPSSALGWVVAALAGVGFVLAVIGWIQGDREVGSGPWLVAAGLAVGVLGLAAFALKLPQGARGIFDRSYVVSSVGAALCWVGFGKLVARRSRPVAVVLTVGFGGLLLVSNVVFQQDWSQSAHDTRQLFRYLEQRYHRNPPAGLTIGPSAKYRNGVRSIHDFFVPEASVVLLGHPIDVHLAETEAEFDKVPPHLRLTWDEVLGDDR